jgi:hypothetical protein
MIQIATGDLGVIHIARIFIFQLMQAALAAAVAEGFKLL